MASASEFKTRSIPAPAQHNASFQRNNAAAAETANLFFRKRKYAMLDRDQHRALCGFLCRGLRRKSLPRRSLSIRGLRRRGRRSRPPKWRPATSEASRPALPAPETPSPKPPVAEVRARRQMTRNSGTAQCPSTSGHTSLCMSICCTTQETFATAAALTASLATAAALFGARSPRRGGGRGTDGEGQWLTSVLCWGGRVERS